MKKYAIILILFVVLISTTAFSQIPMPDALQGTFKKVENVGEELSEWYRENVSQIKDAVNEGTKMYNEGKAKYDQIEGIGEKVKGGYEAASNAVKDPAGAAQQGLDVLSNGINTTGFSDDIQKKFVYEKDITPQQYKKKMEEGHEFMNKKAADLYGLALAHRNSIIEEGKQEEKDFTASNQEEVLRAINMRVPVIVERLNYIQMMEAMSDGLVYFHNLSGYSVSEKEEK